ncbi:acylphosphatase [Cetobacterium ceti]
MLTYHFLVKGVVQGVGYRFTTYLNGKKLNIKGTVKNLEDGSVEIYAQGDEVAIKDFKQYLNIGSSYSSVREIIENTLEAKPFESFSIIY